MCAAWGACLTMTPGPLIPRTRLVGNPDRMAVQLSPDGAKLSYLAPLYNVMNIWVAPTHDITQAQPVTAEKDRGVFFYYWCYTNDRLLFLQDEAGNEHWKLYQVDLGQESVECLTPEEDAQVRVTHLSPLRPDNVLLTINNLKTGIHGIFRMNLKTGARHLVQKNPGFASFVIDDHFEIRLATYVRLDGSRELYTRTATGWSSIDTIPAEDLLTTQPLAFDHLRERLILKDSRGRDKSAVTALRLQSRHRILLAANALADADEVLIHPTEKTVQAVSFTYIRKTWMILDPHLKDDFAVIQSQVCGDFSVVSRSQDDQHWIIADKPDDTPNQYYLYKRSKGQLHFLFQDRAHLARYPLAKMHAVVIPARDDLKLVSYYTLPVNAAREPLPLVVIVHGGPTTRDRYGFNVQHQFFANRGYAALSVNFRGSLGFGKHFVNAATYEWGGKMQDDILDAVDWMIDAGLVDPKRVAIFGNSYGGYAALAGLAFNSERFACGISVSGPSNLVMLMESLPRNSKAVLALWTSRVGDFRTPQGREFLRAHSPITYAHAIRKPVLIIQGANDRRVAQQESEQMVAALQAFGNPVHYALYRNEGHTFIRPENRYSMFALIEEFLARYLKGRFEAFDDFERELILNDHCDLDGVLGAKGSGS